jgi:hypothetical protein
VIVTCDAPDCVRGVVHRGDWGDPCKFCKGLGKISLAELCRRIDEWESTVEGLTRPERRMRARTAARILDKLLRITP